MAGELQHLPSYNPFALKPLRQKMAVRQQNQKILVCARMHAIRKNLYLRRVSQFFDGQNLTKEFLILYYFNTFALELNIFENNGKSKSYKSCTY